MPFRLQSNESIADGLRRLARQELCSESKHLNRAEPLRDATIHEISKSAKKTRPCAPARIQPNPCMLGALVRSFQRARTGRRPGACRRHPRRSPGEARRPGRSGFTGKSVEVPSARKENCAVCHGTTARGDGPLADRMKRRPPDLTVLATQNGGVFPAEQVRKTIDGREFVPGHGGPDMPVWAARSRRRGSARQRNR